MVPPLFRALKLDEAIHAAKTEDKLLLIDFTADWCAPCKQMDKTTWVAPEVIRWVEENAIAVQLDVQKDPADSKRFSVQAMPTLVLMRGSSELDRTTGGRPAAKLLEWLENVKQGRTELDMAREALRDDDPMGWFQYGQMLVQRGRNDEAIVQLERCWLHAVEVEPGWIGVKHSFLANALSGLAAVSTAAKEKFAGWRDAAEQRLTENEAFQDWLTLNGILDSNERVLTWFDANKASPPAAIDLEHARSLIELLREDGRWADYGRLIKRPVDELVRIAQMYGQAPPGVDPERLAAMREFTTRALREEVRAMFKALKAAGRAEDALELEAKALELDPTDEMRDALATT